MVGLQNDAPRAVFAIPGDKDQRTGGYLYNAHVLKLLNARAGKGPVAHMQLPASFPAPSPIDLDNAHAQLAEVPAGVPLLVDGLALGAMTPDAVAGFAAPVIGLVHHPLGLETGLPAATANALIANERAVLGHTKAIVVTSWHTANALIADFGVPPAKITVALPGFERPSVPRRPEKPPLILSVGLLTQRKGHDVLLKALALITDLPWQAEIVGRAHDPGIAEGLHALCAELDLRARVTFRGEIGASALQASYARASIFALATRYEGYGMVLSEAMLHGLPIVSCSVGAVPDTVGDAGWLVPPDDPVAFADALRVMLTMPERAEIFEKHADRLSKNLPQWEDTAASIEDVIENLAS